MALTPGSKVGPYEIVSPLGSGGMGEVYTARDARLGRLVALKILPAALAADPQLRDRFDREARAIAALTHPHIVTIHSIEEHAGAPFLTMELVEGKTLTDVIPSAGLPLQHLLRIAIPLADAVAAAHQRGITHRDLKPGNVMVGTDGRVKVLDFGLAKLNAGTPAAGGFTSLPTEQLTGEGRILGTVAYMSPEQAEGKPVDHRCDIFALGIMLYELATGNRPFSGDSNAALLSSILRDQPPSVSDVNPTMPRELGRIIRRCLEKDPARRIQTALDLRNELEDLRTETTSAISAAAVPVIPGPASSPSTIVMPRRSPAWAAGLGLALLLVAGYLVWARWHPAGRTADDGPGAATAGPALTVTPFENRTKDQSLDPVGAMAADAITQAIPQLDFLSRVSSGASDPKPAARTRATVTGAYYLDGQNLRVQASLADTTGSVLYAIEPAVGPRSDPGAVVGLAQQRMLGAVVTILDPTNLVGRYSRPPLYNAYREFVAGMDLFGNDYPGALQHLKRASELDPDFFAPLWTMCAVYTNTFDRQGRLDTLARIAPMRDRLSRFERLLFDTEIANADGRQLDGLKTLRQAEEVDPENLVVNYLIGHYALRLNRPQETLDEYAKVNAARWNVSTPGGWRYTRMTSANHLLGRHEEELRVALTAKKIFPSALATRADEMYALAALGRMDDLRRAADDLLSLGQSPSAGTLGGALRTVANELRTHGHRAESTELATRGIAWYRGRPQDVQQRENIRSGLAQALYFVEQWEDAAKIVVTLLNEHPDNPMYVGLAGAIAARTGNRDAALKHSAALARMPADGGVASLLRAQIAAVLGDKQAAMDLLRDAVAQGYAYSLVLHQNVDFESLRGYAPFDEFMRPR